MDTADNGSFVLAVESQGRRDPDKPASWAYYLSHLYAKYRTPPVLLVVRPDRSTAAWAARQVDIGPPQWPSLTLRPLVLGPDDLPVINSPEEAARDIPLTVLSAALKDLLADDENTAGILIELTEQGFGKTPAADLWRYLMAADLSFFQSQTAQNLRAERRAEDVLLLLDRRGVEVSEEDRGRIVGCTDLDTLSAWFARAITATSTAELFAPTEDEDGPGA
ncbi:hypothetical protein [Streptomyces triticisoli]|uniref:hypothetical protein n=1 Tax=Streptomyces triticisoli TaxID=2182797 RepID=UPI003F699B95